jgi:hypothetical protein
MTSLAAQWDALLALEPSDWSQLSLELRLDDSQRTEQACVLAGPLNPWREDDDYRRGVLRFLSARTHGYGAAAQLVRARLALLDGEGIGGSLRILRGIDAVNPVATQGAT